MQLHDVFKQVRVEKVIRWKNIQVFPLIDAFVERLKQIDAYGAVVAVNGEILAVDLVDDRKTFRALWESLLRGYAMDAAGEDNDAKRVTKRQVEACSNPCSSRRR
jgi:hypothetical protein